MEGAPVFLVNRTAPGVTVAGAFDGGTLPRSPIGMRVHLLRDCRLLSGVLGGSRVLALPLTLDD